MDYINRRLYVEIYGRVPLLGNPRIYRFKHGGEHSTRVQLKTYKLIILWEPNTGR